MGNGLSDYSSAAFQIHFDLVAINHASKASHCMRVEFHLISTWLQGFFYGYPGFPPFLKTDISHQQNSLSIMKWSKDL